MLEDDAWPLVLLGARVLAVVLLYLFLATAFRALRADLRASSVPAAARQRRQAPAEALPARAPAPVAVGAWSEPSLDLDGDPDEAWEREEDWEADAFPEPAYAPHVSEQARGRARVWVPATAAILALGLGAGAFIYAGGLPGEPPADTAGTSAEATPVDPSRPPAVAPGPGEVTVGLAATEDATVRVTVDGVVQFDGVLRSGERQAWEGSQRIQVWTDSGRTVHLAVNGDDLGPYSPAMGHPDWNRIDFGFWPGWGQ